MAPSPSFLPFVWLIASVCSALLNALILRAWVLEHQLGKLLHGEIWAERSGEHKTADCPGKAAHHYLLVMLLAMQTLPKITIFKLNGYPFNLAA